MPLLCCGSKRRKAVKRRIDDLVQGRVATANDQFDDLILLRSDGTPTYMLSVVVDDRDMGVTHIIRGDDHMTNAAQTGANLCCAGLGCAAICPYTVYSRA